MVALVLFQSLADRYWQVAGCFGAAGQHDVLRTWWVRALQQLHQLGHALVVGVVAQGAGLPPGGNGSCLCRLTTRWLRWQAAAWMPWSPQP